jgi:hydroxymethylbilane synthase
VSAGVEVVIGSRGSALALAQARLVEAALHGAGQATRILIIETAGDRRAPDTAWGEGAFVAAIERALLDGSADIAVHSAKDVPTDEDPRLHIAAYLPRADARDALVVRPEAPGRRLDDLPAGSRVGTDSPRRTGFILARRPDLVVHPLHGNVDTRLRRLDAGETDALVLACAGLDRLGLGSRIGERIDPGVVPPAPGQGAVAVQVRSDDERLLAIAAAIDDRPTRLAVETERAFLAASGGGCRAPIGALATIDGDELELLGGYASVDGAQTSIARLRGRVRDGTVLGTRLAGRLDIGDRFRVTELATRPDRFLDAPRVLVTRAADQATDLESALRDAGLDPIAVPAIAVELDRSGRDLDAAAGRLNTYRWVLVTSANGARAIVEAAIRTGGDLDAPSWAAIGPATARVLDRAGIEVRFQPSERSSDGLAAELPIVAGDRALVIRGDLAGDDLTALLRARGAEVDDVIGYRTSEAPEGSRELLRRAIADGPIEAVVFTSGSTVRGLRSLGQRESIDVGSIPAVCIGPETADAARAEGFRVVAVSPTPDATALAAATAGALAHQLQETR